MVRNGTRGQNYDLRVRVTGAGACNEDVVRCDALEVCDDGTAGCYECDHEWYDKRLAGSNDDYASSEGRVMAGMAHGNRGLADYDGLDTAGPVPCGHHCDWSCPRCGGE